METRKLFATKWAYDGAHGAQLGGDWFSSLHAYDGQVWLHLREGKRKALLEERKFVSFSSTPADCPVRAEFHKRFAADVEGTHPLSLNPSGDAHMDEWNSAVVCKTDAEVNRLLSADYGEEVEMVYCK